MSPLLDHSILFILLFPLNSKMTVSLEFKENVQDRPARSRSDRSEDRNGEGRKPRCLR